MAYQLIRARYETNTAYKAVYSDYKAIMRLCKCSRATAFRLLAKKACATFQDPVTGRKKTVMFTHELIEYSWHSALTRYNASTGPKGNPGFRDPAYQSELARRPRHRKG